MVLPFLVVFFAMLIAPLGYSGYLSLFSRRLVGGEVFVGLSNYAKAVSDPAFQHGLGRVVLVLLVQVPIMLGTALFLALALDSGKVVGRTPIKLLVFLPHAVPGVVATLMWGYLYGGDFGVIAQTFRALGAVPPNLLADGTALGSIMNVVTWEYIGYNMIIMYAALRAVPVELYEAAEIDGAGAWRTAWSIKIPAILPAIFLTLIFSVIGSFQLFNEPNLLAPLAPNVIDTAYTPNLYAYNLAFVNQDLNYASAVAFLLGVTIMGISYVVQLVALKRWSK